NSMPFPDNNSGKVVDDGFQAELHVNTATCREFGIRFIKDIFINFLKTYPNYSLIFKPAHTLTYAELEELPDKSRVFGCMPSKNAYNEKIETPDGRTHPIRYAG